MKADPSIKGMTAYFKLEDEMFDQLLEVFLADPDQPMQWDPISADDFIGLRKNLVGTGFVAQEDNIDAIAARLRATYIQLVFAKGISGIDYRDGDGLIHPRLTQESQTALTTWADDAVEGIEIDRSNTELFKVSSALFETEDGFRKLSLIDQFVDEIRHNDGLCRLFVEGGSATVERSRELDTTGRTMGGLKF